RSPAWPLLQLSQGGSMRVLVGLVALGITSLANATEFSFYSKQHSSFVRIAQSTAQRLGHESAARYGATFRGVSLHSKGFLSDTFKLRFEAPTEGQAK